MQIQEKKAEVLPKEQTNLKENTKKELEIAGFDEVETPEADIVSLGSASYTKMLGKIYA